MRAALATTLGVSLGAHLAVAAALVAFGRHEPAARPLVSVAPGESFELPAPEPPEADAPARASAALGSAAKATRAAKAPGRAPLEAPLRGAGPRAPAAQAESAAVAPSTYGAVGERSAIDLATAFTRGFPQAASADPAWVAAPLGPAGSVELVLTLAPDGRLEDAAVLGEPTAALASGVRRTLALLRGRAFTASGKVTRLRLTASVSADSVHDGLHGDVFAIGGSFAGAEGSAFFALAIGRRVDLRVRAR